MSHLILTTNHLAAATLRQTKLANIALGFCMRFVFGQLPSAEQLLIGLERRSAKHCNPGDHWLDEVCRDWLEGFGTRDIGFLELCAKFDSIEVWIDPQPNDQLVLVWLLDLLRPYKEITTKLSLVHTDDAVTKYYPESVTKWKLPVFKVTDGHLTMASRVWHAWRAPTPEPCFDLLTKGLMLLPRLRPALIAMLEELPGRTTGLGVSQLGMLGFVEDGGTEPWAVLSGAEDTYDKREAGELLFDLADCKAPAIFELGQAPRDPREENLPFQHNGGLLALTELGRALWGCKEDFSRHNTIKRWWGGTELTNERLWRWDDESRSLIAP